MTLEGKNNNSSEWVRKERERDRAWISQNLDMLWDSAVMGSSMSGRGALVIDATTWPPDGEPPAMVVFGYVSQSKIEKLNIEQMNTMVREYDPKRELVIGLIKPKEQWSTYRIQVRQHADLLDAETKAKLPALYNGETLGLEAQALVKFFTPDSDWTWYASEFDGDDTFFGLVAGLAVEFGYFSLHELETTKGPLGLPIERDKSFESKTFYELLVFYKQQGRT